MPKRPQWATGTHRWRADARCLPGSLAILAVTGLIVLATDAMGAVERYKDDAVYLARSVVREDFEGAAWNGARSVDSTLNYVPSITSQRMLWQSAAHDFWAQPGTPALISTNSNWARGPGWGIFDNYLASTLRITAPEPIYGVGLWITTNPCFQDTGFLFEARLRSFGRVSIVGTAP